MVVSFILISIFAVFNYMNISLPYMACGGSTLKSLSNKCIPGFACRYSIPECDGCGGTCLPTLK